MDQINWKKVVNSVNDPRLITLPATQSVKRTAVSPAKVSSTIFLCDAYLDKVEQLGRPVVGGYKWGQWVNIDHHAPTPAMQRFISSTPLAIERVKAYGCAGPDDLVVKNHDDCDSILSTLVMLGNLPPLEQFAQAAVSADHTGRPNDLADLLQACAAANDFGFSLRNLAALGQAQSLEPLAQSLLAKYQADRQQAAKLVEQGKVTILPGGLAWIALDQRVEGVFWPSLLPQAKVILLVSPLDDSHHRMSLRLGLAAPQGSSLNQLKMAQFDRAYGGRWNAGNNSRAGGSNLPPADYAAQLDHRVAKYLRATD